MATYLTPRGLWTITTLTPLVLSTRGFVFPAPACPSRRLGPRLLARQGFLHFGVCACALCSPWVPCSSLSHRAPGFLVVPSSFQFDVCLFAAHVASPLHTDLMPHVDLMPREGDDKSRSPKKCSGSSGYHQEQPWPLRPRWFTWIAVLPAAPSQLRNKLTQTRATTPATNWLTALPDSLTDCCCGREPHGHLSDRP